MKQKPKGILFKGEMIRTLLNTQPDVWPAKPVDESLPWKWQTRRVINPPPCQVALPAGNSDGLVRLRATDDCLSTWSSAATHPPGSILYAKETFFKPDKADPGFAGVVGDYTYRAEYDYREGNVIGGSKWKPSIFMPKSAARLWFRVMNVRVEMVNEISEEDSKAEGVSHLPEDASTVEFDSKKCPQCGGTMLFTSHSMAGASFDTDCGMCDTFKKRYKILWDSINGQGDFDQGKYVWVYELARISKP